MFDDAYGSTCKVVVRLSDLQLSFGRLSADGRLSTKKVLCQVVLDIFPKGADRYSNSIENNGRWEAIMFPHMFKEELSSLLCCCSLLVWYEYSHLGKSVDYY